MLKKSFPTIALLFGVLPGIVLALGLGAIRAGSYLHQPLQAEIELVGVKPQEIDGIRANLAPEREFQKAGTSRAPLLGQLQFQPRVNPSGDPVIGITSEEPIREPFLDFLVEVNWPQGRLVKEYALLLDPPVTLPGIGPPPRLPATMPAAPGQAVADFPVTLRTAAASASDLPAEASGLSYGPVRRGESLWRIAKRIEAPGATRQEIRHAMYILYRANPEAFANGDIDRLREGVVLRLGPIAAVPADRPPDAPAAVAGAPTTHANKPSAAEAASEDQLRILTTPPLQDAAAGMGAVSGGTREGLGALHRDLSLVQEDTEVARQETAQLHQRVQGVEGQLQDIRHLLDIRNAQITELQRDLLGGDPSASGATQGDGATKTAAGQSPAPIAEPPATLPAEADWLTGVRSGFAAALEGASLLPVLISTAMVLSLLLVFVARRRHGAEPVMAPIDGSTALIPAPSTEGLAPGIPLLPPLLLQVGVGKALDRPSETAAAEETDCLQQADFFMEFGRYREAAQLVRSALQRAPGSADLRVKLAEIYHGAGDATAFAGVLRELGSDHGAGLPQQTLDRLLAMGEGLGLDSGLAQSLPLAEAPLASTAALESSPLAGFGLGAGADDAASGDWPLPQPAMLESNGRGGEGFTSGLALDLDAALAEIEQAERERDRLAARKRSPVPSGQAGIDPDDWFNLQPLPEALQRVGAAESPLPGAQPGQLMEPPHTAPLDTEARGRAMRLETDLIKVDLARAYLAMDDAANARVLLEEVIAEGEGAAREESEALLVSLG